MANRIGRRAEARAQSRKHSVRLPDILFLCALGFASLLIWRGTAAAQTPAATQEVSPDGLFCTDAMETEPDTRGHGEDPFAALDAAFLQTKPPMWRRISAPDGGCPEPGLPISA